MLLWRWIFFWIILTPNPVPSLSKSHLMVMVPILFKLLDLTSHYLFWNGTNAIYQNMGIFLILYYRHRGGVIKIICYNYFKMLWKLALFLIVNFLFLIFLFSMLFEYIIVLFSSSNFKIIYILVFDVIGLSRIGANLAFIESIKQMFIDTSHTLN